MFRRHAQEDASMSLALEQDGQHDGKAKGEVPSSGVVVGVVMGVVGLLVLVLVLAVCGGRGDTFEPRKAEAGKKR